MSSCPLWVLGLAALLPCVAVVAIAAAAIEDTPPAQVRSVTVQPKCGGTENMPSLIAVDRKTGDRHLICLNMGTRLLVAVTRPQYDYLTQANSFDGSYACDTTDPLVCVTVDGAPLGTP